MEEPMMKDGTMKEADQGSFIKPMKDSVADLA